MTWDNAIQACKDLGVDATAASVTFYKTWMNVGYKTLLAEFGRTITEKTQTTSTVASQRAYQVPPDFFMVKAVNITIGSTVHVLQPIESQEQWDQITQNTQTGQPAHFFVRSRWGVSGAEILLDPVPAGVYTLTLIYEATDRDLSQDAYTTGTVAVTNGSATVTGSGTAFTVNMVGRYFSVTASTGDNLWYRIVNRPSATILTLENVYEGETVSGVAYAVSEMFALPEEMQPLPVYFAMMHYYMTKQNKDKAGEFYGLFNSGLRAARNRYASKSRDSRVRTGSQGSSFSQAAPSFFPGSVS